MLLGVGCSSWVVSLQSFKCFIYWVHLKKKQQQHLLLYNSSGVSKLFQLVAPLIFPAIGHSSPLGYTIRWIGWQVSHKDSTAPRCGSTGSHGSQFGNHCNSSRCASSHNEGLSASIKWPSPSTGLSLAPMLIKGPSFVRALCMYVCAHVYWEALSLRGTCVVPYYHPLFGRSFT